MDTTKLIQEADMFLSLVNRIHGLYLDAILGFTHNVNYLKEEQYKYINEAEKLKQIVSIEMLDRGVWKYDYHGEAESVRVQHKITLGEFKARNGMAGPNARFFASLCVATIYHYWEGHFRERIADAIGVESNDVKIPIIGDLRLYRISIVHNLGIAIQDMERCTEIAWFKRGDPIELYPNHIEEIIQKVIQGIEQLVNRHLEVT